MAAKSKKVMVRNRVGYYPDEKEQALLEKAGVVFTNPLNIKLTPEMCPEEGFPMEAARAQMLIEENKIEYPPHVVEV